MLGLGPCHHMLTVLGDHSRIQMWADAFAGHPDWDKVFDGFNATVDYPASFFHKELLEAYPDAKVVLSVRDGRAWARSMHDTIWGVLHDDGSVTHHLARAQGRIDPTMCMFTELMTEIHERTGVFGPTPARFDEDALVAGMERHNSEVRANVPSGQLLEWSPADGWEPLCEFLERPVPAAPLPCVNDSGSFNARVIDGAMQKLTGWWSRQPHLAPPGPASTIP